MQTPGSKGVINIKATEKNGHVVNVLTVSEEDGVVFVTTGGMVVRTPVNQIRTTGRNAQGVRVVALKDKQELSTCVRVVAKEDEEGELEAGEE